MMYTDLALEAAELRARELPPQGKLDGVVSRHESRGGFEVDFVEIISEEGERVLEKPKGKYITLDILPAVRREENAFAQACSLVAEYLKPLLPKEEKGCALVAGLGNRAITPDAIGPDCARDIMVTRHVVERMPEYFGSFRPVAAVAPGVLGTTGIETAEFLRGLVRDVGPDLVIVVDALMSRRMSRLCSTVQITDTGVAPGSGLGGNSVKINDAYLGVPVIALGVPTIIDSATLAIDTMHDAGLEGFDEEKIREAGQGFIVTPKEIDRMSAESAKILAYGINLALQDGIGIEDIEAFIR